MTLEQLQHLCKLAKLNGIKTCGELVNYKRKNRIQTNGELFWSLYNDATRKPSRAV